MPLHAFRLVRRVVEDDRLFASEVRRPHAALGNGKKRGDVEGEGRIRRPDSDHPGSLPGPPSCSLLEFSPTRVTSSSESMSDFQRFDGLQALRRVEGSGGIVLREEFSSGLPQADLEVPGEALTVVSGLRQEVVAGQSRLLGDGGSLLRRLSQVVDLTSGSRPARVKTSRLYM